VEPAPTPTPVPTLRFAQVARRLGAAALEAGLTVPAFRSPPRADGVVRTIRRFPGGAVVAVRMKGRPFPDVLADMVEGVVVVNRAEGDTAAQLRLLLTEAAAAGPAPERTEQAAA
jgi:hypothetical protein